jgi:hypothetical protein
MKSSKNDTAKGFSSKQLLIIGALIALIIVVAWALYALNKPQPNADKTAQSTQSATILSIDESLRQNGAIQVCSAGNAGSGNLTSSSTNVVYQISKNKADTEAIINKVAADGGYGALTHTTNDSADFYEGKNADKSATISFVVYSDRKYTTCDPTPSTDPNQTAFILSMTRNK